MGTGWVVPRSRAVFGWRRGTLRPDAVVARLLDWIVSGQLVQDDQGIVSNEPRECAGYGGLVAKEIARLFYAVVQRIGHMYVIEM